MGVSVPFMYANESHRDVHSLHKTFDPKAVTRASWEPKPKPNPRPDGPLLSFNRHPDMHMVLPYRSDMPSMGKRTSRWIKYLRGVQLFLRVLELNSAAALLVLLILITNINTITAWVLRIGSGIIVTSCAYGIYHLSRDAAGRPPASSAAYQFFATLADLSVMGVYAFGALEVHDSSGEWKTRLQNQKMMSYFLPAIYYIFIAAGGLHFISLSISLWLGWAFRKISLMPPDMNPLESNLTARPQHHKRNKSSVATLSTLDGEKRLDTPLESLRRSGMPYEDLSRPPTIPFMHTRTQSRDSLSSRGSHADLPSRQYQISPANAHRASTGSYHATNFSRPNRSHRGSYAQIPRDEPESTESVQPLQSHAERRAAKFTEAWIPTDSLISRTNLRNREMAAASNVRHMKGAQSYSALSQAYNKDDLSDSDHADETEIHEDEDTGDLSTGMHPNPLRCNPTKGTPPRAQTPYSPWKSSSLSEISANARRVSGSGDLADQLSLTKEKSSFPRRSTPHPDVKALSRSYGLLDAAAQASTPVLVGENRKVSSGNDYSSHYSSSGYGRRHVSGKAAEEGFGGILNSRPRPLAGK